METTELEYVGFWLRVWASLIDTLLIVVLTEPIAWAMYGPTDGPKGFTLVDFLMSWVLPAIAIIVFWITKQATPGKMAIGAFVVDAKTGSELSKGQAIGRYFGYFVSCIPLLLGLFWVGFDSKKQGWHDKIAGTVVVRRKKQSVRFKG